MRLFLSFNSLDRNLAEDLIAALRPHLGTDGDIFFAPRHVRGGAFWQESLAQAVGTADAFILLIGTHGVGAWQVPEYYEAHNRRVNDPAFRLVPVMLEGTSAPGLPFLAHMHHLVESDPSSEKSVGNILEAIRAPRTTARAEPWRSTRPYRGLQAMTEADSDFFFGRDAETTHVLHALHTTPDRLPIVLGNSGVGKSSIAQAGVLASLKRQTWPPGNEAPWPSAFRNSRQWAMLTLRPGPRPLRSLVEAFSTLWRLDPLDPGREALHAQWTQQLAQGDASLHGLLEATRDRLAALDEPAPDTILLYVDQAEELYTRADPAQARRFTAVVAAGLDDDRWRVFLSMRSDFYGRLQEDKPLYDRWCRVDAHPLEAQALLDVVRQPAEALGARFSDPAFPTRLVQQTGESTGYLPLLSYLMDDLWVAMQERGDGLLTPGLASADVGGVLAASGDRFLRENPDQTHALRRLITLKLVHLEEGGQALRRRATRGELSPSEWALVTTLASHPWRLLTTGQRDHEGSEPFAEVGHEALLLEWHQLHAWLFGERGQRQFLVWKTGLERARLRHARLPDSERDQALLRGYDLQQARVWRDRRGEDLTRADRAFVDASIRAEEQALEHERALLARARAAQASFLGDLSRRRLAENHIGKALALGLEAVPIDVPDWPTVPIAENALFAAVHAHATAFVTPRVSFVGHRGTVGGADFDSKGGRLVTWSYDGTARLWDTDTGDLRAVLRHDDAVVGATFDPTPDGGEGGKWILTWSRDGTARLWDGDGVAHVALRHTDLVLGARFLTDGRHLLTWSYDGTVRLWDIASGAQQTVLRHEAEIRGVRLLDDESRVLSWSYDGTACIWNLASGNAEVILRHDNEDGVALVRRASLSSDRALLLTAASDGAARVWDAVTGALRFTYRHDSPRVDGRWCGDEGLVLTWSGDATARLWDATTGEQRLLVRHGSSVLGAELSADRHRLLTWSAGGSARLWDRRTGDELTRANHTAMVCGATFLPDEKTLLSWSIDGTARLSPMPESKARTRTLRHDAAIRGATHSADGFWIWTRSDDGTVRLWRASDGHEHAVLRHSGEVLQFLLVQGRGFLTCAADGAATLWDTAGSDQFSPLSHRANLTGGRFARSGRKALTWSEDGTARLWDRQTGSEMFVLRHAQAVVGARFTATEAKILTWSIDGSAGLWDSEDGRALARFHHPTPLLGAALSTDEQQLLTWSEDGLVRVWSTHRDVPITETAHPDITGAAWSPAADRVLTWSGDGRVRLCRLADGTTTELQHGERLRGAAWSPDGTRILTWCRHGHVGLWDADAGVEQHRWRHAGSVQGAAFSANGCRVLSWSTDRTVKLTDLDSKDLTSKTFHHRKTVTGAALDREERRVLSWSQDGTARLWLARTGQQQTVLRHANGIDRATFSADELQVLTTVRGTVHLWDAVRGEALARWSHGEGGAVLAEDRHRLLTWSTQDATARLWPLWRSLPDLVARAREVVATLRPLSKVDRCRAFLDTEGCHTIGGATTRDLALLGDHEKLQSGSVGVGNLTDFAIGVSENEALDIEIAVNQDGRVIAFHSHPMPDLLRLEFHGLTRLLTFVRKDGQTRDAGLPMSPAVAEWLRWADDVLAVQLDDNHKPISSQSLPLVRY